MALIKPIPQRKPTDWTSGVKLLDDCDPEEEAKAIIRYTATVTCRDCFGFGHSSSKCPTGRKFDALRLSHPFVKKVIAGFRGYV